MTRFTRKTRSSLLSEMTTRYANRALEAEELPEDVLHALVEAAGLAPLLFQRAALAFRDSPG